ncbi:MAG TPA: UDP-N-acetylglucosamine 2-epimerase (non-hydrolyzing) [Acidimicrobiales bacterium]|nr:UDP-N-acetylglucosamine 2-epimerase (non-hydrolyzing) [Acidimicrobiales bacterium]
MKTQTVVTVVGARPQFVKAAPVSTALAASGRFSEMLVHTGQHFDPEMSDVFFSDLGLEPPRVNLGVNGGSHAAMTARMLTALEEVLVDNGPAAVIVYGDTNSTLAGALAAAKLNLPVAHVEAGLRSFNRGMPEEINRVVADHTSTLLLCPTSTAMGNLRREGLGDRAVLVGDVMYDAARAAGERAQERAGIRDRLGLDEGGYSVATVHRAENTDRPEHLERVANYLKAQPHPVVLPLHPRTRHAAEHWHIDFGSVLVQLPLGYLDMAGLVRGAASVLTDSGGLQKEAYFHRVPCVTLRDETEWVETIEAGWNRLWTVDEYRPRRDIDEYGDGRAAEAIVAALTAHLDS